MAAGTPERDVVEPRVEGRGMVEELGVLHELVEEPEPIRSPEMAPGGTTPDTTEQTQQKFLRYWHCLVVSCCVVSCRVVSCRVVSCRVVSCRAVSCCDIPCRAVPCLSSFVSFLLFHSSCVVLTSYS